MSNPIEDPIEVAKRQFPPYEPNPVFEVALTAAEYGLGPLGNAVRSQLERFVSDQPERLKYFIQVVMDEVQRHQRQLDCIQDRFSEPEATETMLVALERVTRTQSRERIEGFGRVFGAALSGADLDWDETRAFLYDLERLTKQDIEALRLLDINGGKQASEQDAEFQSRCGRLVGFGLAILKVVSPLGGNLQIYTVSVRGKRLIAALRGEQDL